MRMGSSRLRRGLVPLAVWNLQFAIGCCAYAQGNSSLSESKRETVGQSAKSGASEAESGELRRQALGLTSANKDRSKLEQRLLSAVGDLQLAQKARDEYRDHMLQLNEAILRYLKTSQGDDAQARM